MVEQVRHSPRQDGAVRGLPVGSQVEGGEGMLIFDRPIIFLLGRAGAPRDVEGEGLNIDDIPAFVLGLEKGGEFVAEEVQVETGVAGYVGGVRSGNPPAWRGYLWTPHRSTVAYVDAVPFGLSARSGEDDRDHASPRS